MSDLPFKWDMPIKDGNWRIRDNSGGIHMASLWEGRLIDEIERLRNRLELYATNEDGSRRILLDDTSDGIACRDETIREQDETIDRLRRELAEADASNNATGERLNFWIDRAMTFERELAEARERIRVLEGWVANLGAPKLNSGGRT